MFKFNKKNPFFIFAVVLGLLIFLNIFGLVKPLERPIAFILQPLSQGLYSLGINWGADWDDNRDREALVQEIDDLKKEAAALAIDSAYCLEVAEENDRLRSQLNFSSSNNFKILLANIVAKESAWLVSNASSRDVIINKGRLDGLRPDLGVVSEEGIIIGKIVEVKDSSSLVCLTTSPGCQLAVSLQNENKTQGLTDGRLGLTIEMNYIPQLDKINIGDTVISSSLNDSIPRGLVVGRITSVRSESNEVWQSANIEPLLNFSNLSVVSVIIP
jgi:rod shape-determining protein MreC